MIDLSTLTPAQQIAAIYIGYYDRAADPFGNAFWETALANPSLDLEDIATDFSTQAETLIAYPFLGDPTVEEANAFITEVFLNLFNRPPEGPDDVAEGEIDGLTFWSNALIAAINGDEGAISVGEIILSIIEGAQDVEGGTQDRTTILNKIEVATSWTSAADAAGLNEEDSYGDDEAAQASAKSIIEGVTSDSETVVSAKATIDSFFEGDKPSVPGETYFLTSATDAGPDFTGTENDDEFLAYIQQNPFAGGVSNSLSSADRLDGGAGNDRLYGEVTGEFVGVVGNVSNIDIQPRLKNIEEIDIEARESEFLTAGDFLTGGAVVIDGKNITDHEELSSYYSDGDLKFENVTTLTSSGAARNTEEITIGMDHTDNFNSDCDASDLIVLFDNDYLLSGQDAESDITYFLLDEDAELVGNPDRLNNIDVDGIIFNVINADGTVTEVVIEADAANTAGTHQGFVNALQDPFQAAIDAGLVPQGSQLFLDPARTDFTFLDDGSRSDDIPGIVVRSGDGTELVPTGFSRIEEQIGEYDVYGRFETEGQQIVDEPITVNIDLHKAGRGGEGGDLIIGGKSENTPDGIADGIEVFKINVQGAGNDDPNGGMTKPSNVGTITSTGNELREVYIATDPKFAAGDSYASLTIRNGFDQDTGCDCDDEFLIDVPTNGMGPVALAEPVYSKGGKYGYAGKYGNVESGDLELINADAFKGDLVLGDINAAQNAGRITNADTITAQGGGNVELGLYIDGNETAQAYSVTTGSGNDIVDMKVDGDALDYAGSSLNIFTNGGNDHVIVDGNYIKDGSDDNEVLNQAILDNVEIDTGDGNDMIESVIGSRGNLNIDAGAGDDFINTSGGREVRNEKKHGDDYSSGSSGYDNGHEYAYEDCGPEEAPMQDLACWLFNFDDERWDGGTDDVPGVPTSLAYVGGATVTVTLSGAGVDGDLSAGGGVMAEEAQNGDVDGAIRGVNGYEGSTTIEALNNGNTYWGDQTDVIDAVFSIIESHPVLSKLLTIEMTENNTFVITSKTGGKFDPEDLKVEISQRNMGPEASDWDGVESEARSVFSDSGIVINDLGDANGDDAGPDVADLRTTFGDSTDFFRDSTHDWFSGLSASRDADDDNASDEVQVKDGAASWRETDNVITPGAGDDITVLSTQDGYRSGVDLDRSDDDSSSSDEDGPERQIVADFNEGGDLNSVDNFTPIAGNTLQNGASNETLVFEGMFGDDTIMNFTTADPRDVFVNPLENGAEIKSSTVGEDDFDGEDPTYQPEIFVLELSDPEDGETGALEFGDYTLADVAGLSASEIADDIESSSPITIDGVEYTASASGSTVTFTESGTLDGSTPDVDITDFLDVTGVVVSVVVTQQAAVTDPGLPATTATASEFTVCFDDADVDATYTFDGETVPVQATQTGESIAEAFGIGDFENWDVVWNGDDSVTFTAKEPGSTPIPSISEFVGTNTPGEETFAETLNAGLDFLDYSDYLTSQYDASTGPGPDSNDSNVLRPVVLDYNETNTLGGSGDGAANSNVEANEVAVVRMANDTTDGETWSSLSASDVENLFNNDGSYTGFGDDSSFGNLDAASFSVQTYTKSGTNPTLIGEGKAIFKVENPNNLGDYKVFELTWSGDSSSDSGATVSAKEIGTQDYGTSLTGLDDINLVGSDDYGNLIFNGFAEVLS